MKRENEREKLIKFLREKRNRGEKMSNEERYCRRRRDEYGNYHDTIILPVTVNVIAEIVEHGHTDESHAMFVLENEKKVRMIILMSLNYNAETVCHEYELSVEEMCKIIKNYYSNKRNVKVLLESDIEELCKL